MSPTRRLDATTLLLVGWSVAMSVSAQVMLRHGMAKLVELTGLELGIAAATTPWVIGGLGLYLLGTVSWIAVLSRIDLSVAYPLGSLNYVLITVLSATVLQEAIPPLRWAGTFFILVGILVVARGEARIEPQGEEV